MTTAAELEPHVRALDARIRSDAPAEARAAWIDWRDRWRRAVPRDAAMRLWEDGLARWYAWEWFARGGAAVGEWSTPYVVTPAELTDRMRLVDGAVDAMMADITRQRDRLGADMERGFTVFRAAWKRFHAEHRSVWAHIWMGYVALLRIHARVEEYEQRLEQWRTSIEARGGMVSTPAGRPRAPTADSIAGLAAASKPLMIGAAVVGGLVLIALVRR